MSIEKIFFFFLLVLYLTIFISCNVKNISPNDDVKNVEIGYVENSDTIISGQLYESKIFIKNDYLIDVKSINHQYPIIILNGKKLAADGDTFRFQMKKVLDNDVLQKEYRLHFKMILPKLENNLKDTSITWDRSVIYVQP